MELTKLQQKMLVAYQKLHAKGAKPISRWYILLIAIIAALLLVCTDGLPVEYSKILWLLVGVVVRSFGMTMGYKKVLLKIWPTLDYIIDWKKVDDLVAENATKIEKK